MPAEPLDDIVSWSKTQALWRQDCLRRIAISDGLTEADTTALLEMIKQAAGFKLIEAAQTPEPFTKSHFSGDIHPPIVLKGIANIQGVNRLVANASLEFCPRALTIVYGRNGSGKSGFVKVLRSACRTRIESQDTLKVLANAYGNSSSSPSANIIIGSSAGDISIEWKPGTGRAPQLGQVAVFDSASAELYVDSGKQIRYLPFGLALLHRLNAICLSFKATLETEQKDVVSSKMVSNIIAFETGRETKAQKFNRTISQTSTNEAIEAASAFSDLDSDRLREVTSTLSAGSTAAADIASLVSWVDAVTLECVAAAVALSDDALATVSKLSENATTARASAKLAGKVLFVDEPLAGVSSDSWRALWLAARDYSLSEAYPERAFPVLPSEAAGAECVLCQQPLLSEGAGRMQRFREYMDDTLDRAAAKAEQAVAGAIAALPIFKHLEAGDFLNRVDQIRSRDNLLADVLTRFQPVLAARNAYAAACLTGALGDQISELVAPVQELRDFAKRLATEHLELSRAENADERCKLETEKAELEDRKALNANAIKLIARRDLMIADAAYEKALASVATTGITKRANELVDTHLTAAVISKFNTERELFEIAHLQIGLTRKSGQTKAEFDIDPKTTLTKVTSQILSEGEQRALALASFFTEVALTEGSGPIVIDDPVSSLDRDRSTRVAQRIAEEATKRQVIVFSHDMVFVNQLCHAADAVGLEPATRALFSDYDASGKVDPAGIGWKGLNVAKRVKQLQQHFTPMPKLYSSSPAEYEYQIKGLYGRLRDIYERVVEEVILCDIIKRGSDVVQTQLLRYITVPHALAIRYHEGMSRANTHSHDNPAADTVAVPKPTEFLAHIDELMMLIADFKIAKEEAELARPQMKPKK